MPYLPKRKAVGNPEDARSKPSKQPRLDAFFLPARAAGVNPPAGQGLPLTTVKKAVVPIDAARVESGPRLSDEQKAALRLVVEEGRSVFFTGSAGSSELLLLFIFFFFFFLKACQGFKITWLTSS